MEIDNDVSGTLSHFREVCSPELAAAFYGFEDLYERKLWYQLTESLLYEFYQSSHSKGLKLPLYEKFILKFWNKISVLKLIEFLLLSLQDEGLDVDVSKQLAYLSDLKEMIEKSTKDEEGEPDLEHLQAMVFISTEIARISLDLGELDKSKEIIDECSDKIEKLNFVDNMIYANFYRTVAAYYKTQEDYTSFYYTSLLYLACIDLEKLPINVKETLAFELSFAALSADRVFNFGEILIHDIFQCFRAEDIWLKELLLKLNAGDIDGFSSLLSLHSDKVANQQFLQEKICIMCLIELLSMKSSNSRNIAFSEVVEGIKLINNSNEVEHLIMRCLSLGLVKGAINEVNGVFEVEWVQPRILNLDQISKMKDKMAVWASNVAQLSDFMESNGKELWV